MFSSVISAVAAISVAAVAAFAVTEEAPKAPATKRPFYGNATCPTSGEKVDPAVYLEHNGERVYFCCKNCQTKESADVAAAYAKAYPADKATDAKNATCPVMGEVLEADAKQIVVQGHKVGICCPGCDKKIRKAANHYLAVAADANLVELKNKKCPMSGNDVNKNSCLIIDGVLVDFCCDKCVAATEKDAAKVLKDGGIDLAKVKEEAAKKREGAKKDG
jgi:hypothetical protein